jgi:hypothetical protein
MRVESPSGRADEGKIVRRAHRRALFDCRQQAGIETVIL